MKKDPFPLTRVVVRSYTFHRGIHAGDNAEDSFHHNRPHGRIEPVFFWRLEHDFVAFHDRIVPDDARAMLIKKIDERIKRGKVKNNYSYTTLVLGASNGTRLYEYRFTDCLASMKKCLSGGNMTIKDGA